MMRHGKKIHRLGRPADQRKALLRALTTQLLTHGAIKTTKQKARAVRPWVDKMILLAKEGSDDKRKQARRGQAHKPRHGATRCVSVTSSPLLTHASPAL
jgi:ribosomal protein L17